MTPYMSKTSFFSPGDPQFDRIFSRFPDGLPPYSVPATIPEDHPFRKEYLHAAKNGRWPAIPGVDVAYIPRWALVTHNYSTHMVMADVWSITEAVRADGIISSIFPEPEFIKSAVAHSKGSPIYTIIQMPTISRVALADAMLAFITRVEHDSYSLKRNVTVQPLEDDWIYLRYSLPVLDQGRMRRFGHNGHYICDGFRGLADAVDFIARMTTRPL